MVRRHLAVFACVALLGAAPAAPGVQRTTVALTPGARWRATIDKVAVGRDEDRVFYQWQLIIRDPKGQVAFMSPGEWDIPFSRVSKAAGVSRWFPVADGKFAGSGRLMPGTAQQLVVQSRQAAADCGTARVDVLYYDAALKTIEPAFSVTNGCDLSAKIVHAKNGDVLAVTGPYYGPKAPLCCPTKNRATAIFRFRNGEWIQKPQYFRVNTLVLLYSEQH